MKACYRELLPSTTSVRHTCNEPPSIVAEALGTNAERVIDLTVSAAAPPLVRNTVGHRHRRAVVMVEEYVGGLIESRADLIVHQTNCTSTASGGLATDMFSRFPYVYFN